MTEFYVYDKREPFGTARYDNKLDRIKPGVTNNINNKKILTTDEIQRELLRRRRKKIQESIDALKGLFGRQLIAVPVPEAIPPISEREASDVAAELVTSTSFMGDLDPSATIAQYPVASYIRYIGVMTLEEPIYVSDGLDNVISGTLNSGPTIVSERHSFLFKTNRPSLGSAIADGLQAIADSRPNLGEQL